MMRCPSVAAIWIWLLRYARVDHLLQAALVAAGGDESRGVERLPDLLRRDRAVGALVEVVELKASVADARQVLKDRREAARERRQGTEVGRVLGKVASAEIAAAERFKRGIASRSDHCCTPSRSRGTKRLPPPWSSLPCPCPCPCAGTAAAGGRR